MKFLTTAITALMLITPSLATLTPSTSLQNRDLGAWTISGLTRECGDTDCNYFFSIVTNDGNDNPCIIDDISPNPARHAWYNVPCYNNQDFHISWGWDYNNDFTVMTVVHEPTQMEAFFGFNHPNEQSWFADVGPNAVQSTGVHT